MVQGSAQILNQFGIEAWIGLGILGQVLGFIGVEPMVEESPHLGPGPRVAHHALGLCADLLGCHELAPVGGLRQRGQPVVALRTDDKVDQVILDKSQVVIHQGALEITGEMKDMAKAAIDHMARTAAIELAQHRIRVNIVHPGWIDTPGERKFFSEEQLDEGARGLPMGRMGSPEEMAHGVCFTLSDEAAYMTGSTLTMDGGVGLPWWSKRTEGKQ